MVKKKKIGKKENIIFHFAEFRNRLLHCFLFFIVCFGVSYLFAENVFLFLARPLGGSKMIYTSLTEGFFTYLRVSYFMALFWSIPYFLLELWGFVSPALYEKERKSVFPFLIATPFLFYLGGFFVYLLVVPNAWTFFLSFQNENIELSAKISEYLSLIMSLIIAFGLCFEIPVILAMLSKFGIVTIESLKKFRKYFIILAFVCGAFLTPPDIISQLFLATAIILLFELSILMIKFLNK
jgi:sec-independent protein translocase protein TatC